jgi:two-component system, OmpR family, KDP operon response regulator KdpE
MRNGGGEVRQSQQKVVRLRASGARPEISVSSKEFSFNFDRRVFAVRGKAVHLTPKEVEVLSQLVANHDWPISHRQLLQAVWGSGSGDETQLLRVVINQLRKKIESDPAKPKYIQTEPWVGYRFVLPENARITSRQ